MPQRSSPYRFVLLLLVSGTICWGAGCGDDKSFGPIDPAGPGGSGGINPPDLSGIWYNSPDPYNWPSLSCPAGLSFRLCLAGQSDIVHTGETFTGDFLCYEDGFQSQLAGTFTTSSSGVMTETGCGSVGCFTAQHLFTINADGGASYIPQTVTMTSGSYTGSVCTAFGQGLAYPEAMTVPVVAGLYDYVVTEDTGPCPTCGNSLTNTFYVLQNEAVLLGVIPDTDYGMLIYDGVVDSGGTAPYVLQSASSSPCGSLSDSGTITFSAGIITGRGQSSCDGCACDYSTAGTRR